MRILGVVVVFLCLIAFGCSGGGGNVATPDIPQNASRETSDNASHYLWGYWQGIVDVENETIDFVRLREGNFHLNALVFLEPPPLLNLTLEFLEINGNFITADIGLRHPFLGLTEFTGFDVCGIFISQGSITGFNDPNLAMAGPDDMRLLNSDGMSRWWNPTEFPANGSFQGYKDGLLGAPDALIDFQGTLNGYKYYCDDLGEILDPITNVDPLGRGVFSAGQKNVRRFELEMGTSGLVFNYAVDANWQFPNGAPPFAAPDDFAAEANRVEAWNVVVTELNNTLYNDGTVSGGDLSLSIDVYDWFNADLNTVRVESPGNLAMVESTTIIGSGPGYSTYQVDLVGGTPAEGSIDLLISVISEETDFAGFIPGTNTTSYFMHTSDVAVDSPLGFTLELDENYTIDGPFHDCAPGIITNAAGDVVTIGYLKFTSVSGTTSDYEESNDSGANWSLPYYSTYGTGWGSPPPPNQIVTSMAIDAEDTAYHNLDVHTSTLYSLLVKFATQPPYNNSGIYAISSTYANSVVFSNEGYAIIFGDYNNTISYKISDKLNWAHPNAGWLGWLSLPLQTAVNPPARLSRTMNIARDPSNNVHFIYFSSDASGTWIRMATNTDQVPAGGWSTSTVYDSVTDGYDRARDPSLKLESDGDWHSAFILHTNNPSSTESIAYCRTNDLPNWSDPVIAYSVSGVDRLNDPSVDIAVVEGQEIIAITYSEDDNIYMIFSWDQGETWEPPTLLGTGSDYRPEMCSTADGYIHNVWEHNKGTDYRIDYIRGHFVPN